jgi:tetratricopeptide (TPR) repeat protein
VTFNAVTQIRPDEPLAHRLRAETLLAARRPREAGAALDQYLEIAAAVAPSRRTPEQTRTLAGAYSARGVLHAEAGELRSAIDCYTLALRTERGPEVLRLRGWSYLLAGSPALALAEFEEALQQRPGDGDALLGRSDARVKLGRVAEAVADVEAGLKAGPATARQSYNAARVYAQAAGRVLDAPGADFGAVLRYQGRAVALLRESLERRPAAERAAFWREFVQKDPVLQPVRRTTAFLALAGEYSGRPGN